MHFHLQSYIVGWKLYFSIYFQTLHSNNPLPYMLTYEQFFPKQTNAILVLSVTNHTYDLKGKLRWIKFSRLQFFIRWNVSLNVLRKCKIPLWELEQITSVFLSNRIHQKMYQWFSIRWSFYHFLILITIRCRRFWYDETKRKTEHLKAYWMGLSEVVETIVQYKKDGDPIVDEEARWGRIFTFDNHISMFFKAAAAATVIGSKYLCFSNSIII